MDEGKEVIRGRMVVEEVAGDSAAKVSSTSVEGAVAEKPVPPVQQYQPLYQPKKSGSPIFWILIPGIFILGAILGGIVFYEKGVGGSNLSPTPIPTAAPVVTVTPTATPSATVDLTKYSVSIFNGSGIAGEAGKAKTLLTTAGFTVGSTANAATYDYTKTLIKAKTTVDTNFVTALSTALGKTYVVDTAQTLATSSADSIQVVIGSSKAQ